MKKQIEQDPNKRTDHIDHKGRVSFTYPEHFTMQQRGFTPGGRPSLNFPKMDNLTKTKATRIKSAAELKLVGLMKDRDKKTKQQSRIAALKIIHSLPPAIRNIYLNN